MSQNDKFGINGRFLTQPATGVQRYALNVTRAISDIMIAQGEKARLLAPPDSADPQLGGVFFKEIGQFSGHIWEQSALPSACPNYLLNFCNTAPALKTNQIVCIHDVNVFIEPNSYSKSFRTFYKILQPLIARRSAQITTVSTFSAGQIAQHLSLDASEIVVLPNGHEHVYAWDPSQARHAPSALRRNSDGVLKPFILAIGSRARHKNLSLLLGMAREFSDIGVDLVVAGGNIDIFASEAPINSSNVQYVGFVTDHDLAYLINNALCLAFPSLTEGFGLPVLEAMALGCPVISTDRASLPEVCGHATLMASPSNPLEWMLHVRALLESSSLREDLIGRGLDQAKLFSWNKTAQGYLDLVHPHNQRNNKYVPAPSILPKVALVIATFGRPNIVEQTLKRILDNQSYKPDITIISCVNYDDVGDISQWPNVNIVTGRPGLAAQRNTALAAISGDIDIVVFFDDDFVPEAEWLNVAARLFCDEKNIVGFTGDVLMDGIKGPGLSFEAVDSLLAVTAPVTLPLLIEPFSPYGCNMAFRLSAIGSLRFDERLVLYGWLEDRDFGAALAARGGRLVKCNAARGVHMGVKSGRIAGDRLGYSQIVNPLYLLRKGTMTRGQVIDHIFRNVASNVARYFSPEYFIDRRGRLRGNLRGLIDVFLGRLEPERALQIISKVLN